MSIFQGQPLQLPELGLHVAPSKVVNWAKSTLEKIRALPALGQDVNILHLNVGAAMLKAWSVTYSDKPDAPDWAYPNDLDLVATKSCSEEEPARVAPGVVGEAHKVLRGVRCGCTVPCDSEGCTVQHEYRNDGCSGRVDTKNRYGGNDDARGNSRGGRS